MNCKDHGRYNCSNTTCRAERNRSAVTSNSGRLGLNTEGNLTIGLGSGLTLDVTDGSLGSVIGRALS